MLKIITSLLGGLALELVKGMFKIYTAVTDLSLDPSTYNTVLPHLNELMYVFKALGVFILFISFLNELLKSLAAPALGEQPNASPIQLVIRFILYGILFYMITNLLQYIMSQVISPLYTTITNYVSGYTPNRMTVDYTSDNFKFSDSVNIIFTGIWGFIFGGAAAFSIFMASFHTVERYIVFYLCYALSPLAVAVGFSPERSEVTKQYAISMLSQFLALVLTQVIFALGMNRISVILATDGGEISSNKALQCLIIATVLFNVAKNSEKILEGFHLRSLPTFSSCMAFSAGVAGAMRVTRGAMKAGGLAKKTAVGTYHGAKAAKDYRAAKKASNSFASSVSGSNALDKTFSNSRFDPRTKEGRKNLEKMRDGKWGELGTNPAQLADMANLSKTKPGFFNTKVQTGVSGNGGIVGSAMRQRAGRLLDKANAMKDWSEGKNESPMGISTVGELSSVMPSIKQNAERAGIRLNDNDRVNYNPKTKFLTFNGYSTDKSGHAVKTQFAIPSPSSGMDWTGKTVGGIQLSNSRLVDSFDDKPLMMYETNPCCEERSLNHLKKYTNYLGSETGYSSMSGSDFDARTNIHDGSDNATVGNVAFGPNGFGAMRVRVANPDGTFKYEDRVLVDASHFNELSPNEEIGDTGIIYDDKCVMRYLGKKGNSTVEISGIKIPQKNPGNNKYDNELCEHWRSYESVINEKYLENESKKAEREEKEVE